MKLGEGGGGGTEFSPHHVSSIVVQRTFLIMFVLKESTLICKIAHFANYVFTERSQFFTPGLPAKDATSVTT